jgi:hypothetical protein
MGPAPRALPRREGVLIDVGDPESGPHTPRSIASWRAIAYASARASACRPRAAAYAAGSTAIHSSASIPDPHRRSPIPSPDHPTSARSKQSITPLCGMRKCWRKAGPHGGEMGAKPEKNAPAEPVRGGARSPSRSCGRRYGRSYERTFSSRLM